MITTLCLFKHQLILLNYKILNIILYCIIINYNNQNIIVMEIKKIGYIIGATIILFLSKDVIIRTLKSLKESIIIDK